MINRVVTVQNYKLAKKHIIQRTCLENLEWSSPSKFNGDKST